MKIELRQKNFTREKIIRKQRSIEKLIALALSGKDEESITEGAQAILEEIRLESDSNIQKQLVDLEAVTHLPNLSDTQELEEAITDTAEHLLEEIKNDRELAHKIGLSATLASLHTWDRFRTPETEKLCEVTLDNFPGVAKAALNEAFIVARDKDIPYEDAHDIIIENMTAA